MKLSARVDYALRAVSELAVAQGPRNVEQLSVAQGIPAKYLESILGELRRGQLLRSQRGPVGGFRLARPAEEISVADVIRALEGELANVRGNRPEELEYSGAAAPLQQVWIALRASERAILESVTLAHVASGEMPEMVRTLVAEPAAWARPSRRTS
ncbi:Rrf2 family transcriptional regulator [Desertihabitans brevis]|uniref:Rrf2 family transcriptional regulator n=1 Tax=Desertihabitans brevis TaxID=2268447 RepID=A0A367YYC3_9ACTN|nr:Rrf2 family transcriptional regulator [Desertihabitans brevis]RCK70818.1 Rrf2 family transcriptional regulator [Desertihabitans brevis]